jgi:lipopolysaccharide assembly protein A
MRWFSKRETAQTEDKVFDSAAPPVVQEPVRTGGRTAAAWTAVAIGVLVAVALVVFLAQNTRQVEVSFLGFNGSVPVAVALLAAAVFGAAVVLVVGTARVTKLRLAARQLRRRDADRRA